MVNQVIIVGRLVYDPSLTVTEEGTKSTTITLAIQRSNRNDSGEYDTDFIPCTLHNALAENTVKHCKKGATLGVKARLVAPEEGVSIIAEKVTFISSGKGV